MKHSFKTLLSLALGSIIMMACSNDGNKKTQKAASEIDDVSISQIIEDFENIPTPTSIDLMKMVNSLGVSYVFDGWHAENNTAVLNEQSLVQTASDQTLYADWTMLGDVLRDESINLQDVALLTRYLAGGWDTTGIHVSASDVNRDGEVNLKDAVLIRRYLAGGWNVELI